MPLSGLDLRISVNPKMFFDTRAVRRAVDKAKRRVLIQQGAYLRKVAQNLIHRRRGASRPPHPPHSHVGLLRDHIFYGYDRAAESVVVGPRVFSAALDIPGLLEFGGRHPRTGRQYSPRPYMGPALERSGPKLAEIWEDSVKG